MAHGFNETSVTFGATTFDAKVRSAGVNISAPDVDVTGAGDDAATSEIGIPKSDADLEFLGTCPLEVGDTGDLSLAFGDGETVAFGQAGVLSKSKSGSMNGVCIWKVKFVQVA